MNEERRFFLISWFFFSQLKNPIKKLTDFKKVFSNFYAIYNFSQSEILRIVPLF
jgi:hypothetical protein